MDQKRHHFPDLHNMHLHPSLARRRTTTLHLTRKHVPQDAHLLGPSSERSYTKRCEAFHHGSLEQEYGLKYIMRNRLVHHVMLRKQK